MPSEGCLGKGTARSTRTITVSSGFSHLGPTCLAALAAVLVALPGITFAFLFDDYNFILRTLRFRVAALLPDSGSLLYRPISREVYFGLLNLVAPDSPVVGHVVNALLLFAIVLLGATLASRISGRRAGAVAGILLAAFSPWPVLVAWVSGCQDLLAICFVLVAIHFECRRRGLAASLAFAVAILSKETAVFAAPALAGARWLGSQSPGQTARAAVRVTSILAIWMLIHPGIRVLLSFGGASPPGGYIGFNNPGRWLYLVRFIPVLLNAPLTGYPTPWPQEYTWTLGVAAIPLWMAFRSMLRESVPSRGPSTQPGPMVPPHHATAFGTILAAPPLLFTSLLVQHWAPYYACFAIVGTVVAIAPWLARLPGRLLTILLAVYIIGGFWSRGIELPPGLPTERGLEPAGRGLRQLEKNFKRVAPQLPASCVVYVGTMATGPQSIYIHLHSFQVLRAWYRDPEIQTIRPELKVLTSSPEALFAVEPDLGVILIDPVKLTVRSSNGPPPRQYCRNVLTSYAIGLAQTGNLQGCVEILTRLSNENTWDHVADMRIAATMLLCDGQGAAARALLSGLPQFPPDVAINHVGLLLTVPTRGTRFENAALEAFGLPLNDPRVYRFLLRGLLQLGYDQVAARIATRLLALQPGDLEAQRAVVEAKSKMREAAFQIMPDVPTLRFPSD